MMKCIGKEIREKKKKKRVAFFFSFHLSNDPDNQYSPKYTSNSRLLFSLQNPGSPL